MLKIILGVVLGVWLTNQPLNEWLEYINHNQKIKETLPLISKLFAPKYPETTSGELKKGEPKKSIPIDEVSEVRLEKVEKKLKKIEKDLRKIKLDQQREALSAELHLLYKQLTATQLGEENE